MVYISLELDNNQEMGMVVSMFSFKTCNHQDCLAYVCCGSDTCYHHSQNKEQLLSLCTEQLSNGQKLLDISITDAEFADVCLPPKKEIVTSNFAWSTFSNIDFSHSKILTSFFDFCLFDNCKFIDLDCRYSVFGGSKFVNCNFSNSLILHSNFSGVDCRNCDFSSSDLYYSNFASSYLRDSSFEDCNLKKADFSFIDQRRVSFKYSNYQEARN